MRSRVVIAGHPLHPMLIPFPFAFLTGAWVFHVAGWMLSHPALWRTGSYLAFAGVATGLVAALPGLVDFIFVVPPKSTGKQRALIHMVANATALTLFAIAWLLRGPLSDGALTVAGLETFGAAALATGGWMGGTLVYRNQIAIDHRYAQAGKWRESAVNPKGRKIVAAHKDELQRNQMKLLRVGDRRIVLARTEDGYAAFDDHCTHRGGSLADGATICGIVQCPWHGSQFDTRTGAVKAGPAEEPIGAYKVSERGDEVIVELGSE